MGDSNDKSSASHSLGRLSSRAVVQQFYVGPDRFVVREVFLSVFWWIYCYNKHGQEHTFPSRRFGLERMKRLDGNVCSCPRYIATIDPAKDTEKYIVDDKVVQSNTKLLTKSPTGQTTKTTKRRQIVVRVPP